MRVLMSVVLFGILAGFGASGCAKKSEPREATGAKAEQAGKELAEISHQSYCARLSFVA